MKLPKEVREEYFKETGMHSDDDTIMAWLFSDDFGDPRDPYGVGEKIAEYVISTSPGKQVGGAHYERMVIEPWDYITANGLDYLEGNVIKYVSRHKTKNGKQDIQKAIQYLTKMMANYDKLYGVDK